MSHKIRIQDRTGQKNDCSYSTSLDAYSSIAGKAGCCQTADCTDQKSFGYTIQWSKGEDECKASQSRSHKIGGIKLIRLFRKSSKCKADANAGADEAYAEENAGDENADGILHPYRRLLGHQYVNDYR